MGKILKGQLGLFDGPGSITDLPPVYLSQQMAEIYHIMIDGVWRTGKELSHFTGHNYDSILAQLRNLRKSMYGYHLVEVRLRGSGLHEYKLHKNYEVRVGLSSNVTKKNEKTN